MAQKSKSAKSSVSREDRLFAVKYLIDNKLSYTQCVNHLKRDFPEKYGGDSAVTTSDLAVWKSRHKNQDVSALLKEAQEEFKRKHKIMKTRSPKHKKKKKRSKTPEKSSDEAKDKESENVQEDEEIIWQCLNDLIAADNQCQDIQATRDIMIGRIARSL